jgi:alkylhydroperoxidase/carboxymuconolactone decarboxylase family protein YurZ
MRNIRTISTGWAGLEVGSMFGPYLQSRAFKQLVPEIHDTFQAFSQTASADGALTAKTKQLIALD